MSKRIVKKRGARTSRERPGGRTQYVFVKIFNSKFNKNVIHVKMISIRVSTSCQVGPYASVIMVDVLDLHGSYMIVTW